MSSTSTPAPAKRPRIDPPPGGLSLPAPSPSTASPLALPSPRPTASPAPATPGARPYPPVPQSGLALPTWGGSQQHQVVIDPALQNASSPVAGPSSAASPYAYATAPPHTPQQNRTAAGTYLPQQSYYAYAQAQQNPYQTHTGYTYPAPTTPYAQQPYARTAQTPYQYSLPRTPAPIIAAAAAAAATAATPTPPPPPVPQVPQNNQLDSNDVNELNDALGSAGVDIRAEQDAMQRAHQFYQPNQNPVMRDDRSRKQAFVSPRILGPTMRSIASKHNVSKVSEDSINYAALALRERLLSLITTSVQARDHRATSTVSRPPGVYTDNSTPMWSQVVRRDVARQLSAIEKVDREEEARVRRERRAAIESSGALDADGQGAGEDGEDSATGKKRKRKDAGPGITAKNMSEETRYKMTNSAAALATGSAAKKYNWMTPAALSAANATAARKPGAPSPSPASPATTPATNGAFAVKPVTGGWMRAPMPQAVSNGFGAATRRAEEEAARQISLRDVEFAIEKEKGHGGGRGSARGWT